MQGFLNVYKPSGIGSSTVVAKIKKHFHIDKVGHMGTLDPMASGILPIAVGKATRMFDYFMDKTKRYIAVFDFNYTTDTLDATGVVTAKGTKTISLAEINKVIPNLVGEIDQIPPIFSAKNVGGVRAYTLARNGEKVELNAKRVYIKNIICTREISTNVFQFDITCGSGTYIRSIARDIASILGTVACMTSLDRIESGKFIKQDSVGLDVLLESNQIEKYLIDIDKVFDGFGKIQLNDMTERLLNGLIVKLDLHNGNYFLIQDDIPLAVVSVNENMAKMKTYLKE